MLLSIDNFKSIEHVADVDLSGLTVLAGVNSSGKSSLIQALLLLKQTLCTSSNDMLNLAGPYVYASSVMDLMHNKRSGIMRFSLALFPAEIVKSDLEDFREMGYDLDSFKIDVAFKVSSENYTVSEFRIILCHKDGQKSEMMLKLRPRKGTYDLSSKGVALLNKLEDLKLDKYSFANFFPVFAAKGSEIHNLTLFKASRELLRHSLERLVYIAPLRVAPVLARTYNMDVESHHVLPDGENTRFIIDSISGNTELIGLLKYWICKRFQLAKDISIVKETGKRYRALITTNEGLKVDLMHMGFGLSQILPIVTQGCISVKGSTLIVEDPDVHMHPSIQAAMADFFIFLSLEKGVTVLIETHSDHFITRIRRRVAEGGVPTSDIHLIFVENEYGESIYQSIPLSNKGKLEGSMPNGFLDSLDADFRAIIKAGLK